MGEDEQNTWTFSIKMPDGTMLPFSGTIESVEVTDMERKVKPGDRIRIIKPWMTNGRYEKGDVLTVKGVGFAGVFVQENDWYIDENEYEIIADEIKPGDKVRLIDEPWEWEGWAKLPRPLRLIYKGLMGKEYALEKVMNRVKISYLQNTICADIDGLYIIPLAILRKVEPVDFPFDVEPEPVKAEAEKQQTKHANGTVGRYIGGKFCPVFFSDGDLIKRKEDARGEFWPLWVRESDGLYQRCEDKWVDPVKAEPERAPMTNEPHPEIKEGAKFVVVKKPYNQGLKVGDVLVLRKNDNSRCPYFYHNEERRCEYWENLAPLEAKHQYTDEQITEAKMIIGRLVVDLESCTDLAFIEDGNLTKLYIDGRKVSEAKCSPDDEPNKAIGRMVAMLRRFGEPLPTWIRG